MKLVEKKRMIWILLFITIISLVNAQERCLPGDVPDLDIPNSMVLNEDENFIYFINSTKTVTYSWAPINISMDFDIDKKTGIIDLNPTHEDVGRHSVFIIVTTPKGCFDIERLDIIVYDKPVITNYEPNKKQIRIQETEYIIFTINATTSTNKLEYEWYHSDRILKEETQKYIFRTNFTSSGTHYITAVAKDSRKMNSSYEWIVSVGERNRPPYFKYDPPSIVVGNNTKGILFNIYDYVYDPDGDNLEFKTYFIEENKPENLINESKIITVNTNLLGDFSLERIAEIYIKQHIRIEAKDPSGARTLSKPFTVRLATEEDTFDLFQRQSVIEKCEVKIRCEEWSECLPTNIKVRECRDINNCNNESKKIIESEECDYDANCDDNIKNQGEEGVDCGGPCEPCPTCNDGIMNQGEEGVDCGGPCEPCPSCFDALLNQDETDIDCGGVCYACESGKNCLYHTDCKSHVCFDNICVEATCNDFRQNQNETGVDCGGPCEPCPTCNDGIMNQGEEGVDCGGPCKSCMTCHDGIRNQGEILTDCGGPCDSCRIFSSIKNAKKYFVLGVPIFVFLIILHLVRMRYRKDKIGFNKDLAKLFRFLPNNLPENYVSIIIDTINNLHKVRQENFNLQNKKKISENYINTLQEFFRKMFGIEGTFTKAVLKSSTKTKIKNPFLASLFVELYNYTANLSPEAPLFKIELNEKIDDSIKTINIIRDLI